MRGREPKQQHHHPFDDPRNAPAWAQTLNGNLELLDYRLEMLLMLTKEEIVAKLAANNTALVEIFDRVDNLDGNFSSVTEAIADLKAQVAAGQTPDFSDVEAAMATQSDTIARIRSALGSDAPPPEAAPTQEPAPVD